jgi:hypothetical protein
MIPLLGIALYLIIPLWYVSFGRVANVGFGVGAVYLTGDENKGTRTEIGQ